MTSEPDSTSRRRPPTIDLTATEVKPEQAVPEAGPQRREDAGRAAAAAQPRSAGTLTAMVGALCGAVVVAGIGAGLWFAGVVPSRDAAPMPGNGDIGAISAQLRQIQAALAARPAEGVFAPRIAALEGQLKALNDTLAAANRRIDGVAVAAQSAREHADAATAAAQSAGKAADAAAAAAQAAGKTAAAAAAAAKAAPQNAVSHSDLDALTERIAALEGTIKTLSNKPAQAPPSGGDRTARAAVAAEALRSVVERGAPFPAELIAVKAFGADQNAVAALAPFADSGVPSDAALAHELAQLLPKLRPPPAAPAASGGGILGRIEDHAKGLVHITPVGAPVMGDAPSAIARLVSDAARADIASALTDVAALPPSAKTAADGWVRKVKSRDAAIAASRRIAAAALAELASANTQ